MNRLQSPNAKGLCFCQSDEFRQFVESSNAKHAQELALRMKRLDQLYEAIKLANHTTPEAFSYVYRYDKLKPQVEKYKHELGLLQKDAVSMDLTAAYHKLVSLETALAYNHLKAIGFYSLRFIDSDEFARQSLAKMSMVVRSYTSDIKKLKKFQKQLQEAGELLYAEDAKGFASRSMIQLKDSKKRAARELEQRLEPLEKLAKENEAMQLLLNARDLGCKTKESLEETRQAVLEAKDKLFQNEQILTQCKVAKENVIDLVEFILDEIKFYIDRELYVDKEFFETYKL